LDLLHKKKFSIHTNVGFNVLINLTNISKYKGDFKKFDKLKVLFNREYLPYINEITVFEKNVFLPKELFHKILALEPSAFLPQMDKVADSGYALVEIGHGQRQPIKPGDQWGLLLVPGEGRELKGELTLKEFIERWDDLIVSSVSWLNRNSTYQELNIPFLRDYYKSIKR
jgi:hypothetical protein